MALVPNSDQVEFAAVGVYGAGYISPTALLAEREIRKKIFDGYHEDDLFEYLFQSGRREVSANTKVQWFEHDPLWQVGLVESASGTTGVGNAVTITLEEASHTESGARSLFKVNDVVGINTAAGGLLKGFVTAVNKSSASNHTVTVKPKADVDLVSNVATADQIFLITDAHADGTDQPDGRVRKPVPQSTFIQTIKSNFKVFGGEAANRSSVEVGGKPYYYLQGVVDNVNQHKMKMNYGLMIGLDSDGTDFTDPVSGDPVYMTDSLESVLDERGNTLTYTTFALTDLADMSKLHSRQRSSKEQLLLTGVNLDIAIDDFAKGKLDNTAINYAEFGKGSNGMKAIDFGFNQISYGGITYHKQCAQALDYVGSTGFTGSPYPDLGFCVPLAMVKAGQKGEMLPTISVMTKESDRGSRYMREDVKDGFKQKDGNDSFSFDILSDVALRLIGAKQMIKIKK